MKQFAPHEDSSSIVHTRSGDLVAVSYSKSFNAFTGTLNIYRWHASRWKKVGQLGGEEALAGISSTLKPIQTAHLVGRAPNFIVESAGATNLIFSVAAQSTHGKWRWVPFAVGGIRGDGIAGSYARVKGNALVIGPGNICATCPQGPVTTYLYVSAKTEFVATHKVTTAPTPTTTTIGPTENAAAAIIATVSQAENESISYITAQLDPNNSSWALWKINDPNVGLGYGFAEEVDGSWQVVSGPGSATVGCTSPGMVPSQILSDFGLTCPATPEEQFESDAIDQVKTVLSAINAGTLTRDQLGQYGDNICNLMPQYISYYGNGASAFNQIANEFAMGFTNFHITGPDDGLFVSLAIEDICPQYASDIPSGATG